jgi:hypothetical protein
VAISGIAARLASQVNDVYIAGHWSSSLPLDLLWQREWDGATGRLIDGPTWSWTVAAGTIKTSNQITGDQSQERFAQFLDAKIVLQHETAPYGAVKEASLTVKGRIRQMECQNLQGDIGSQHRWNQDRFKIGRDLHLMFDYYSATGYEGTIDLFEIYHRPSEYSAYDGMQSSSSSGLVLREILPSRAIRKFTRVGTFTCIDARVPGAAVPSPFFGQQEEVIELV